MANDKPELAPRGRISENDAAPFFATRPIPPDLEGLVARFIAYRENGQALHLAPEIAAMVVPRW